MRLRHPDLLVCFLITLLTLFLGLSGIRSGNTEYETMPVWMAPLGILMVLFIPGYALISAVLPRVGSEKTLLLSLGLSICISAVGGLIQNLTPWGITTLTHSIWLSLISMAGLYFTWRQRRTLARNFEMGMPSLKRENTIIFGLAGFLLLTSVLIAYISSIQTETIYTQLWAVPTMSEEGEYQILAGIRNEEKRFQTYSLYLDIDGRRLDDWPTIPLASGDEWTTIIQLTEKPSRPIRISLYRINEMNNVYRWLRISPEAFK